MKQELPGMIALAERLLATDIPGTLATLFSARGSTYRTLGSMMVSVPGLHAGGISGGCLEEYVARAGERATRDTPAALLSFSTHPDSDDDVPVLGCGGAIDVLVERLTPHHLDWLKQFASACEADEPSLTACVVTRSAGRDVAERTCLQGRNNELLAASAIKALCAGVLAEHRSRHMSLGHGLDVLVHYVRPLTRLVIAGAGDDAQPLCALGFALGWHVTVVDRRTRFATAARFPHANVVAADWDEALSNVVFTPHTAAVLMTHSLHDDARALSQLSAKECAYIGVLGPSHRRQWLLEEVVAQGTALTARCLERLRGPIGLDLGDRSPAGIAVAIAAEILASMNRRRGLPLCDDGTHAHIDRERVGYV